MNGKSAGSIGASAKRYIVTENHAHSALQIGDIVVMVEDPNYNNWLLLERDMTLHRLQDTHGQYVHLTEKGN